MDIHKTQRQIDEEIEDEEKRDKKRFQDKYGAMVIREEEYNSTYEKVRINNKGWFKC